MIYKLNLIKLFVFIGIIFVLSLINPQKISAQCTNGYTQGPVTNPPAEYCQSGNNNTDASGVAVYSCANYASLSGQYGCYFHYYYCNTPCGGSGPPSGGGGQCTDPSAWGINCPAGTVKGTTIVNTQCKRPTYCAGAGTAQTYTNTCCAWQYFPDDCQLVWRPNQRRWDEVCYPVPPACLYNSLITYNCVPITPTCTVDVLPQTIAAGSGVVFPASIPANNGVITQVDFVSSNPAVATVTTPDTTASYSTTATGLSAGTTNITANVVMSGSVRCTDTATLTVTNTTAWWQVRDGDVTAGNGDISSSVPTGQLFNTNGAGGLVY